MQSNNLMFLFNDLLKKTIADIHNEIEQSTVINDMRFILKTYSK